MIKEKRGRCQEKTLVILHFIFKVHCVSLFPLETQKKHPPLTEEINVESLCLKHLQVGLMAQGLSLSRCVQAFVLLVVELDGPFKGSPGEREAAKQVVLDDHLSCREQQLS